MEHHIKAALSMVLLLCVITGAAVAGEFSVKLKQFSHTAGTDDFDARGWGGLELSYKPDNTDTFYFVSQERAAIYTTGKAYDLDMTGIGFGFKPQITKKIRAFAQVGYYFIDNSWGDRRRGFNEGLHQGFNKWYAGVYDNWIDFQEYTVKTEDTLGGEFGVEYTHNFTKNFTIGLSYSKRIMNVRIHHQAFRDVWDDRYSYWENQSNRNLGSDIFGASLSYLF